MLAQVHVQSSYMGKVKCNLQISEITGHLKSLVIWNHWSCEITGHL